MSFNFSDVQYFIFSHVAKDVEDWFGRGDVSASPLTYNIKYNITDEQQ